MTLLDFLNFTFQDAPHFFGVLVLICAPITIVSSIFAR